MFSSFTVSIDLLRFIDIWIVAIEMRRGEVQISSPGYYEPFSENL